MWRVWEIANRRLSWIAGWLLEHGWLLLADDEQWSVGYRGFIIGSREPSSGAPGSEILRDTSPRIWIPFPGARDQVLLRSLALAYFLRCSNLRNFDINCRIFRLSFKILLAKTVASVALNWSVSTNRSPQHRNSWSTWWQPRVYQVIVRFCGICLKVW
jgi:hypothetical protein